MGYVAAAKNLMLDALGAVAVYVSLHTDDPGTIGSNEVSGGSPAYARSTFRPAQLWPTLASGLLRPREPSMVLVLSILRFSPIRAPTPCLTPTLT